MKKINALLCAAVLLLTLCACSVKKTSGDTSASATAQTASSAASAADASSAAGAAKDEDAFTSQSVNFAAAMKKLSRKQKKLIEEIGVTEKDKKIVGTYDNDTETQVVVCTFKKGVVSHVDNYRFYKNDKVFEGMRHVPELSDRFELFEDEKCLKADETIKYRGKTYAQMLKAMNGYDIQY